MLEILITLLQAFHLMAVNVASAGPLVAIWLHRRWTRHGDETAGIVGQRLAKGSLSMLVVGSVLGFIGLGLTWVGDEASYRAAAAQIPAKRYAFALAELVFSLVLLLLYARLWERMARHPWWHALLAVLAATNLLYHFPPLLTMLSVIPTRPELAGQVIDLQTYRSLLVDPEVVSRSVHVILASFAMAGVYLMGLAPRLARGANASEENASRVAAWGARVAMLATVPQLFVGTWVLLKLPSVARKAVMGRDTTATLLFAGSMLLTLALLHFLASAMHGGQRKTVVRVMIVMTLLIVLMTGTVRRVRHLLTPTAAAALDNAALASEPAK